MNTFHTNLLKLLLPLSCFSLILCLTACQQDGAAEKTGKKIDQTTEKTEKKLESVKKEVVGEAKSVKESVSTDTKNAENYLDDTMITAKIKEKIMADDFLKMSQIQVTTVNGVVTLSGSVDSEQQIANAIELAKSRDGVKSVESNLILKTDAASK